MRWLRPSKPPVIEPVETTWSVAEGLITVIEVLEMTCSKPVYRFCIIILRLVDNFTGVSVKNSLLNNLKYFKLILKCYIFICFFEYVILACFDCHASPEMTFLLLNLFFL